jgi:transcriptional regulator with XRE-family HTH domain
VSSFQRARQALGLRLRELRRDARLTGRQLAAVHGWHPSKISKIEGGKQTPSESDIQAWVQACGQPELAAELVASLRTLEGQYVEFRRMFRAGQRATQEAVAEIEGESESIRNCESTFVPGLLQTPEYARYRLAESLEDSCSDARPCSPLILKQLCEQSQAPCLSTEHAGRTVTAESRTVLE